MQQNRNPITSSIPKCLFLVWGTPDQGPRSRVMADKLGIEAHFVYTSLPRGALYVPVKYSVQAVRTMFLLFRERPQVVWVQNPPLLAGLCVCFYCSLTGAGYVVDAHSEALLSRGWTAPPAWIKSFLAQRAMTTIVTNERLKQMVSELGGRALIIRDVPTTFKVHTNYPVSDKFQRGADQHICCRRAADQVLKAADDLAGIQFYITGKLGRKAFWPSHKERRPTFILPTFCLTKLLWFAECSPGRHVPDDSRSHDAARCMRGALAGQTDHHIRLAHASPIL